MINLILNIISILCLFQIAELYYFTSRENVVNEEFKKAGVQDKVQSTMFGALIIFVLLFFSGRNPFGIHLWKIEFDLEKDPGIMEILTLAMLGIYLWNYSKVVVPETKGLIKLFRSKKKAINEKR